MPSPDPRIDAYIEKSAPFARPILRHLREVVHRGCPEAEETLKWGMPHFTYQGILCSMASFKEHVAFGFWQGEAMLEQGGERAREGMGNFGRIRSLADLPSEEELIGLIHQAMRLNESGRKAPRTKTTAARAAHAMTDDFRAALDASPAARATYDAFPPSKQTDYLEWIGSAKREETRRTRIATAVEWLAEGKSRNWKYER